MTVTFGSEFVRLCKLKGVTQTSVGTALGVDRGYLSRVANDVNGFVPTEDRIAHIATILTLTESERDGLFFAAGKMPPEVIQGMRRDPRLFKVVRKAMQRLQVG